LGICGGGHPRRGSENGHQLTHRPRQGDIGQSVATVNGGNGIDDGPVTEYLNYKRLLQSPFDTTMNRPAAEKLNKIQYIFLLIILFNFPSEARLKLIGVNFAAVS
jgi:hypothetical protein